MTTRWPPTVRDYRQRSARAGGVVSTTVWQITGCGPGCSHVRSSLGCTIELQLADNRWQATRTLPAECTGEPSTISYSLDAAALTGTITNSIACTEPRRSRWWPRHSPKTEVTGAGLGAPRGRRTPPWAGGAVLGFYPVRIRY